MMLLSRSSFCLEILPLKTNVCSDAAFTNLIVHHFTFYCFMLECEPILCTSSFQGFHILNKK